MVPVDQTRPPPANNAPLNRGTGNGSRPPSYGNSSYEEALMTKPDATEQRQQQQQQRRRGYRRTDEPGQEPEQIPAPMQQQQQQLVSNRTRPTPAVRTGSLQNQNQSPPNPQARAQTNPSSKRGSEPQSPKSSSPVKQEAVRPENNNLKAGNSIPRLNSPSVSQVVLQPLDAKVQEYGNQMLTEEKLMAQLDSEMAALQERRRAADNRFMAAKSKHDDYRRQYLGVERALKGEQNQPITRSPRSSFDE
jgi:hypothetical protein